MVRSAVLGLALGLLLAVVVQPGTANEVFGCGGFVKNVNSELDLSKVEVGLYVFPFS